MYKWLLTAMCISFAVLGDPMPVAEDFFSEIEWFHSRNDEDEIYTRMYDKLEQIQKDSIPKSLKYRWKRNSSSPYGPDEITVSYFLQNKYSSERKYLTQKVRLDYVWTYDKGIYNSICPTEYFVRFPVDTSDGYRVLKYLSLLEDADSASSGIYPMDQSDDCWKNRYKSDHFNNDIEYHKISAYNCNLYLADIIVNKLSGGTIQRKYSYEDYKVHIGTNLDWVASAIDNATSIIELDNYMNTELYRTKDDNTFHTANNIVYLAMLSLLDNDFYTANAEEIENLIEEYKYWLDFASPLWGDNNIAIKGYSALALLELLGDEKTSLTTLNTIINTKFSAVTNGKSGFGEGTGYLKYALNELMPLYYFIKKLNLGNGATIETTNVTPRPGTPSWWNQSFKLYSAPNSLLAAKVGASANWLLEIMDNSGHVLAVDDALCSRDYWLAPFGYINADNRFIEHVKNGYSSVNYCSGSEVAKFFLTYPTGIANNYNSLTIPAVTFTNGVGKINHKNADNSFTTVSIIAEEGTLLKEGASHDQQDNFSFTVRRSVGNESDELICDIGYAGFGNEYEFGHYIANTFINHNITVPMHSLNAILGGHSYPQIIKKNSYWGLEEFKDLARDLGVLRTDFGEWFVGTLAEIFSIDLGNTPMGAGGNPARLRGQYSNALSLEMDCSNANVNKMYRTVLEVGGDIYVMDAVPSDVTFSNKSFIIPENQLVANMLNLPEESTSSGNQINATSGNSSIRVTAFSHGDVTLNKFDAETYKLNGGDGSKTVTKFAFCQKSDVSTDFTSFLTILETGKINTPASSKIEKVETSCSGTICLRKEYSQKYRYVFINKPYASVNTFNVSILGQTLLSTNAEFGYIDVNKNGLIEDIKLYNTSFASLDGTSFLSAYKKEFFYKPPLDMTPIFMLLLG